MKPSPEEIRRQEFSRTFRGFASHEVISFLEAIAAGVEELRNENNSLRQHVTTLESQLRDYRSVEQAFQQTILQAQETSARAVENARKESQLIIQEAELKASFVTDNARQDLANLREQITILKAKKDSMVSRLKMLLQSELDVLKALEFEEGLREDAPGSSGLSKEKMEIEEIIKSLE